MMKIIKTLNSMTTFEDEKGNQIELFEDGALLEARFGDVDYELWTYGSHQYWKRKNTRGRISNAFYAWVEEAEKEAKSLQEVTKTAGFTVENIQTKHSLSLDEKSEIVSHCNKYTVKPVVDGVYDSMNYLLEYFRDVYSMNQSQTMASLKKNKAYFCELSNGKVIELKG